MIDVRETPREAAHRLAAGPIAEGYKPEAIHAYKDASGEPQYWKIRLKHPDGRKWIRPMRLNGSGFVIGEPEFPNGKPLYRLNLIVTKDQARVWITEGEKAADALIKIGAVATTSGSATSAAAADWSPLAGRECVLWPDNDDAGKAYAVEVAALLERIGCRYTAVDIDRLGLPPRGDAADWASDRGNASVSDLDWLPRLTPSRPAERALQPDLSGPKVTMVRGDTVNPEPVRWIWSGWLARGKLHVLAGTAGTGKTTLALAMAASVTIAGRWPDGSRAEPGNVVIWSGEDDPADTLVPRLLAMGADMARVHFVGAVLEAQGRRAFDPATDVPLLAERLRECGDVALLVVDPIVSAVASDSHKNGEVRRSLQPLVDVAAVQGCALVGITHYSKSTSGRDPLERVTGSLAFGALPRIVMGTAKPTEAGAMRRLVRAKSNIGPDGGGFEYDLQQAQVPGKCELFASRVLWGEPIDGTARELLAEVETEPDEAGGENPKEFLRYLLAAGSMPAAAVFRDAEAHGYSKRQMQRARTAIGARVEKQGMRGGWEWSLTKVPPLPEDTEDANHKNEEPSAPSAVSSPEIGEVF